MLVTRIPTPEQVFHEGPYEPSRLRVEEKPVQTHECARKGAMPLYMKERRGIPPTEEELAALAKERERATKVAEARRRAWARRRDFGGPVEPPPGEATP
jgi:hypothetical protein